MPERSNRLLALDWLERAQAQLVAASYELTIVGPLCEMHWDKARGKLVLARERLDLVDQFIEAALEPFSVDLAREKEKVVTRRTKR